MKTPSRSPDIQPRELKNGAGWYVLVDWGHRPHEEVGFFSSQADAQTWIDTSVFDWLKRRFDEPEFGGQPRSRRFT